MKVCCRSKMMFGKLVSLVMWHVAPLLCTSLQTFYKQFLQPWFILLLLSSMLTILMYTHISLFPPQDMEKWAKSMNAQKEALKDGLRKLSAPTAAGRKEAAAADAGFAILEKVVGCLPYLAICWSWWNIYVDWFGKEWQYDLFLTCLTQVVFMDHTDLQYV